MRLMIVILFLVSIQSVIAQESPEEILVEGELTLIRKNNLYFLRHKGSDEAVHLDGRIKNKLAKQLRNCPLAAAKASNDVSKLPEIIRMYNECVAVSNPNLEGILKPVTFTALIGADYTILGYSRQVQDQDIRYLTSSDKPKDKSYLQFGAEVSMRNYQKSNFASLYVGILYGSNRYDEKQSYYYDSRLEYSEYTLEFSEIKIPIGVEFKKPSAKPVSSHFRFGIAIPKTFGVEATHPVFRRSNAAGQSVDLPQGNITDFQRKLILSAGAGLDFRVAGRPRFRIQGTWSGGNFKVKVKQGLSTMEVPGYAQALNLMFGFIL